MVRDSWRGRRAHSYSFKESKICFATASIALFYFILQKLFDLKSNQHLIKKNVFQPLNSTRQAEGNVDDLLPSIFEEEVLRNATNFENRLVNESTSPSPSQQPAADRDLTEAASGLERYLNAGFPNFWYCAPAQPSLPTPDQDGCVKMLAAPSQHANNYSKIFHITHDGCQNTLSAVRQYSESRNLILYTLESLPPHVIDFDDPPLSIIGTSFKHTRTLRGGAVAELATHIAIWREHFLSGVNETVPPATVLSEGYNLAESLPSLPEFHIAILSAKPYDPTEARIWRVFNVENAYAYIVSHEGANRLLSSSTAFVRPLAQLIGALAKTLDANGEPFLQVLEVRGGVKEGKCSRRLRNEGREIRSHLLPFYPPHHHLYEIRE